MKKWALNDAGNMVGTRRHICVCTFEINIFTYAMRTTRKVSDFKELDFYQAQKLPNEVATSQQPPSSWLHIDNHHLLPSSNEPPAKMHYSTELTERS